MHMLSPLLDIAVAGSLAQASLRASAVYAPAADTITGLDVFVLRAASGPPVRASRWRHAISALLSPISGPTLSHPR